MPRDGVPYEQSKAILISVIKDRKITVNELKEDLNAESAVHLRKSWSWGRVQYVTNMMIKERTLHARRNVRGNKVVSLTPFPPVNLPDTTTLVPMVTMDIGPGQVVVDEELVNVCILQNDIIRAITGSTLMEYKDRLEKIGIIDGVDDTMLDRTRIGSIIVKHVLETLRVTDEQLAAINEKLSSIIKKEDANQ